MNEYLESPMLRYPLNKFDMDYPVDGADAFIITTVERAADLPHPPVLLHAASQGVLTEHAVEGVRGFAYTGSDVVMKQLWAQSDVGLSGIDLFLPYDGFTIIALVWTEAAGYCGVGEAGPFVVDHWNPVTQRIEIDGRVLVNSHGGGLSEGGVQGANHVREAVVQLRREAGARQIPGVSTALVTLGTFFHNSGGMIFRSPG